MQHFKITNIHTNKVLNLNYTELQTMMSKNRKDFFYNYTIQRVNKTSVFEKIFFAIIFFACSIGIGALFLEALTRI